MSECKICGTGCQWVFCGDCEKLIGNGIDEYDRTIADLTAKLKLAVEALEHYANNAHWDEYEDEFNGESGWYSIFNKTVDFGNKVAEAALKQIGEPAKGRDI